MITLADVRDWLKTYGTAENYYAGKLDNKLDRSIGVYQRNRSGAPVTAIGGRGRRALGEGATPATT